MDNQQLEKLLEKKKQEHLNLPRELNSRTWNES